MKGTSPEPNRTRRRGRCLLLCAILGLGLTALLSGPAATQLQVPDQQLPAGQIPDAVYLVCGAKAQHRRLQALIQWLDDQPHPPQHILIGNDTQNSLWSSKHQRNLTRAEWAREALQAYKHPSGMAFALSITPGSFSNTDGEMQALARYLRNNPDLRTLGLVTSRYHARRVYLRLAAHAPAYLQAYSIPGLPHWRNRAPWTVLAEWLKILRDTTNLSQHPWLSRQPVH